MSGLVPLPFFEHPEPPPSLRGRLLLLSFHFPPAQTAGSQRWERLAHFAFERGWGLDVVTQDPSDLEVKDPARLAKLPAGTRVYGVPHREAWTQVPERWLRGVLRGGTSAGSPSPGEDAPTGERAVPAPERPASFHQNEISFDPLSPRHWIRAYNAWLEAARDGGWAREAARVARAIAGPEHVAVISCGPPHWVHVGARRLAEQLQLPLVLDLRDPWSFGERVPEEFASPLRRLMATHHERKALRRAALLAMNTEAAHAEMVRLYPEHSDIIVAVSNGFDGDPLPEPPADKRFRVVYAGTIYLGRDPRVLFRAAARVVRELALSPDEFGIEFMGAVESIQGQTIDQIAEEAGIGTHFQQLPAGTRSAAAGLLAQGTLLVNLPQDSTLAIPSKIFEYLRYPAWLLALEPAGTATERLLRDTPADVVEPEDEAGIARVLRAHIEEFRSRGRPAPIADGAPQCSRAFQAARFFDALDVALAGSR